MSELTILLTSYNRPFFVQRTLDSLQAQTCPAWRCIVLDDNSGEETLRVLEQYRDERIEIRRHATTEEERRQKSRYAVLINSVLPEMDSGIIGYLCDNVEYEPELVETVLAAFDAQPDMYCGYVLHQRDVWSRDGHKQLGPASQFGHWDLTPPKVHTFYGDVDGLLDHSQVFHRLPAGVPWNESIEAVKHGDGLFFTLLNLLHGPIRPILAGDGQPLTKEHLFV